MWRHYDVILENSDITTRPWQRLATVLDLSRTVLDDYIFYRYFVYRYFVYFPFDV
jgi:hypothetical protein